MNNIGKIIFIGAGRMAGAIAGGLVECGFPAENMSAYDVSDKAAEAFSGKTGIKAYNSSEDAFRADSDIIILAVKPQYLASAMVTIKSHVKDQLIVSIAAGVTLERLAELTGSRRLIRVMPNAPALVGAGVSAYTIDDAVSEKDSDTVEKIFGAVGQVVRVEEKLMDAVTGLSGSGPAYVFDFIQALADGGVHEGLPRDTALKLAVQTVLGAAEMVKKTGEHPAALRDMVTSPGGTTVRALSVLDNGAFRDLVADAVIAASERSKELGK